MYRLLGGGAAAALTVAIGIALSAPLAPAQSGQVTAGVGVADSSWHVGAAAGQYAGAPESPEPSEEDPTGNAPEFVSHEAETFDPTGHATRRYPSYGMQSRLSIRAIVVDGPAAGAGDRFAILKNDQYIPQDLVYRRAGQILEAEHAGCGIGPENLTMAATHDHSSPMYSSTSWGVWAFQDVFDVRFFEYLARQMAEAVNNACDSMVPVRVGAAKADFDKTPRHSYGPDTADDGSPAGYPKSNVDRDLTVVRFDDVSDAGNPEPLVNLVNFSVHPEFLEGNDLISADYVGPLERMLDRETDAITVYTQGAVGTSEPERSEWHSIHERLEFSHKDYAQAEWGARLMANAAKGAWQQAGQPSSPIPFQTNFPVQFTDRWYPGPFSHPFPTVSNCKTDKGLEGNPRLPVLPGLPTCTDTNLSDSLDSLGNEIRNQACENLEPPECPSQDDLPVQDPGLSSGDLPGVPANYGAPGYSGLEEDIDVHLQTIRLGELLLTACSCEQWFDQSTNIETRTDKTAGNEYLGYDWSTTCTKNNNGAYSTDGSGNGTGTWSCVHPNGNLQVSDYAYNRMRAQVLNDATGWNNAANAATAENEPADPRLIKGNYSHDDDALSASLGYDLTIPIGMANDYNGYIASYREYQQGDHYRKALTAWGPHSSDYMATRLVTMARQMKNPLLVLPQDQTEESVLAEKAAADTALNDQRATAIGTTGGAAIDAYEAGLPDDGGDAEILDEPQDIERFDAAFVRWNGGSNFTDNPEVTVQRETSPGNWEDYADQSGELPVTLKFPTTQEGAPAYTQGNQQWHWTARFEAMVAGAEDQPINTGDRAPATPPGTYRFHIEGQRRDGGAPVDYELDSEIFQVRPWDGILVQDFRLEQDGTMSFQVGPTSHRTPGGPVALNCPPDVIGPVDYPDTHADPAPFIRYQLSCRTAGGDPDVEWFCLTCTWRPWLDYGDAETAVVRITLGNGTTETATATRQGGRWVTSRQLREGETAVVETGDALDPYGNTNQRSITLGPGTAPADADGDGVLDSTPDNCPLDPNPDQADSDSDGAGDVCEIPDPDGDHDGVPDATDACPGVAGPPSNQGCPIPAPTDTDGDGVLDASDGCPDVPGPPDNGGCPVTAPEPTDVDGDGVPNSADDCPITPGTIDNFGCPLPGAQLPAADPGDCGVRRAGTQGRDSLIGTAAGDLLLGRRGGDRVDGGDGPDCVFGGPGPDRLDGQGGEDLVRGGDGRDRVKGGEGNDVVSGGRGPDGIAGGNGDDSLRAVDGHVDRVDCGPGDDRAQVGQDDRVRNCETVKRVKRLH